MKRWYENDPLFNFCAETAAFISPTAADALSRTGLLPPLHRAS